MFIESENREILITLVIAILIFVSYLLQFLITNQVTKQKKILTTPNQTSVKQAIQIIFGQLLVATFVVGTSLYAGGLYFDFFAGGYLLNLLVGIMLSIQMLLYYRGLAIDSSAEGQIKFSMAFSYKNMAHRLFSSGLLLLLLFIIFGNFSYLGGVLFTWSTASGYIRKSKQCSA